MPPIRYRRGYEYQLAEDHEVHIPEFAGYKGVSTDWYELTPTGMLWVRKGFCWDGLTGAVDDRGSIKPSLYHDIACEAVNEGRLPVKFRNDGDRVFYRTMRENGVAWPVARWRLRAVQGYFYIAGKSQPKPILEAP